MAPAVGSWVLALALIPALGITGFLTFRLGAALLGSQYSRFEVSHAGLEIHGDVYGLSIPTQALVGDGVRIVDMARDAAIQPVRRIRGIAIPGYRAGWFRLADGQKALLYVTTEDQVVYVPTTKGYVLLLSASDPEAFAASIRSIANN